MPRLFAFVSFILISGFALVSHGQEPKLPRNAKITRNKDGKITAVRLTGPSSADKAKIAAETLKEIASIPTLESLYLDFTDVSDEALKPVKQLKSLKVLDLSYTNVTGNSIRELASFRSLLSLRLEGCEVNDEHLEALSEMPQLANLYLGRTQVADKGLRHIAKLSELVLLDLSDTSITDDGLQSLGHFKQLQHLWLSKTIRHGENDRSRLTDASVPYLSSLTTLVDLRIADSRLTEHGLTQLRRALSKTNINTTRTGITYISAKKP
jgi:hypothetical protein